VVPEPSEQARLLTVIGAANGAAKENESVIMAAAEQLPGVPGKRRSIECDQDQRSLGA
jgi:hypothetical protein